MEGRKLTVTTSDAPRQVAVSDIQRENLTTAKERERTVSMQITAHFKKIEGETVQPIYKVAVPHMEARSQD